jgi:hypothetical protein
MFVTQNLGASPSLLQKSGDWVTVSYSGVAAPTKNDWVGLYAPVDVDFTRYVPIKFQFCASSPDYMKTGSGSIKFRILNVRDDLIFALLRNGIILSSFTLHLQIYNQKTMTMMHACIGTDHGVVAAKSNAVSFLHRNEPTQGHLALTDHQDEMRVTWTTHNSSTPTVRWGESSGQYTHYTGATTTTYTKVTHLTILTCKIDRLDV